MAPRTTSVHIFVSSIDHVHLMLQMTLPPRLHEILLQHLQAEEGILQRMQEFAAGINHAGFEVRSLTEQQAGLSQLVGDLFALQLQRQALRGAIARLCQCEPETVVLSRIQLATPQANATLDRYRQDLAQRAEQTKACLQTAETTLRGWAGIVNFVLGELLGSAGTSDRYAANGQRIASSRVGAIDVRT